MLFRSERHLDRMLRQRDELETAIGELRDQIGSVAGMLKDKSAQTAA